MAKPSGNPLPPAGGLKSWLVMEMVMSLVMEMEMVSVMALERMPRCRAWERRCTLECLNRMEGISQWGA